MGGIINKYLELSQEFRFHSILLFFPEIKKASDGSLKEPQYKAFVRSLRRRYAARGVTIIDISEAAFDLDKFRVLPERGHTSVYGNKIISEFVYANICNSTRIPCT